MTAHILDLVCLWILFYAYGQKVLLGTLVAGYAIGVLFWIVSITPQGIGVVEGLMAIVYTSLHIKSEIAVVVSLAFRGLAFWLPLLIGFFMLQRVKTFSTTERRKAGTWNVRLIAILTGLMGVLNILSATTPAIAGRLTLLEQILLPPS